MRLRGVGEAPWDFFQPQLLAWERAETQRGHDRGQDRGQGTEAHPGDSPLSLPATGSLRAETWMSHAWAEPGHTSAPSATMTA